MGDELLQAVTARLRGVVREADALGRLGGDEFAVIAEELIHTLVQLGKALSIEPSAEGIEQEEELSLLQAESCDSGQGFLFARPLDASATRASCRAGARPRS